MAYNAQDAFLMRSYQRQYPNADLYKLAAIAGIPAADVPNYTINTVATPPKNAAYGAVTSKAATETQVKTATPRTGVNPITGRPYSEATATPVVTSTSQTASINPITGRQFVTPPTPAVTSTSQTATNTTGSGTAFQGGGTIASQAFGDRTPAPVPSPPAPPPPRPVPEDPEVDFTEAYGDSYTEVTPIPPNTRQPGVAQTPPAPPPPRPSQTEADTDVDFDDAYGEDFRTVTPIPASTRLPGVEQATLPPGSRGSGEFLDDRGRAPAEQPDPFPAPPPARPAQEISQVDDFGGTPVPQVDDFGGPNRNITPVDDFGDYSPPVTQVDDFGAPSRNVTPVDDFSGYSDNDFGDEDPGLDAFGPGPTPPPATVTDYNQPQFDPFGDVVEPQAQVDDFGDYSDNDFGAEVDDFAEYSAPPQVDDFGDYQSPAQVDDFAEINTPTQVDDFGDYSDNDFGTEDPGLDAFGPGPAPAQVDDFADYQSPAQVDDFAEFQAPTQVDDFGDYSDNDFGTEDPGLDAFGPGPAPVQVDDYGDYSDNDFGAEVDDFGGPNRNVTPVDDYGDYSDNDFGDEDPGLDAFGTGTEVTEVNSFNEYGTKLNDEIQYDDFGDPIVPSEAQVNVDSYDEYGTRINDETQYDEFGNVIPPRVDNDGESLVGDDDTFLNDPDANAGIDGVEQAAAINAQAMKQRAQQQQTISEMREASGVKNADGDWRVKLRLAPQATYLYKAANPGILAPLTDTDGIIFPYTPTIDVQYRAEYQNYSPTHSNYQHYFYKGSSVQTVQLQADFTAQDTVEAEYLLAVIHFLKSASKMFYGQDAQRGSPPPLLYLTGLGEYQFNESPCVISEFNYNLPNDVNYIRARSRHIDRTDNLQYSKPLATSATNGSFSSLNRLRTAVTNALNGGPGPELQPGADAYRPSPGNLGSKGASYVPTKMSMTINLLPIVSRKQVSQQFSLREYANGNLIKKGMW